MGPDRAHENKSAIMGESINYGEFSRLEYLRGKREGLGQERLEIDQLAAQAGSQDQNLAERAKRRLRAKWDLEPDKDAQNALTVDLLEQIRGYSEEEKKAMFSQMVGIQLTEGCNGNCPFCLFGKKKGVEAKYSFESVAAFLRKYGPLLPKRLLVFYWDSDPFDFREGEHNFKDVYGVWREIRPNQGHFVSTAIPRGGEKDFVDFMRYIAKEQRGKLPFPTLKVRVSLAKHNIQRVEAVFQKLTAALLQDGCLPEEINNFYGSCVDFGERFENILKIGALIGGHEDIRDIQTPACSDGVLLTPRSLKAIVMTAPTVYEPSGEKDIEIVPGRAGEQTPLRRYRGDKDMQPMMTSVMTHDGKRYELQDTVEDLVLKLGRDAASIGGLIEDLSLSAWEKRKKIETIANAFRKRQEMVRAQAERAKKLVSQGRLTLPEAEKLSFYILLAETYLAEMDFIADQIRGRQSTETITAITAIASLFRQIGRDQASQLPKIIEGLMEIGKETKKGGIGERDIARIKTMLLETAGKPFGIHSIEQEDAPDWFKKVVTSYIHLSEKSMTSGRESLRDRLLKRILIFR